MKYDKINSFSKELSSIQKTLDSYQSLYRQTAVNSLSKSLQQFQSTVTNQINSSAITTIGTMCNEMNDRMSSFAHSYKIVNPYSTIASDLGSCFKQVVSQGYGAKVLTDYIKSISTEVLVPGLASSIFNKNVIDNTITVPSSIAKNISDTLGISDDDFKPAVPYADSKKVSPEKFALYLSFVSSIIGILMNLVYIPVHDYFSDKSTSKYQNQMLQEERKQTELLEKIHIDLQKNNSSTTKEK